MKKFKWRLQRLLDIKEKKETAMRAELVTVTEQAVAVRSKIILEKSLLRQMFVELGQKEAKERLDEQEIVLKYSHVRDERIRRLKLELAELEQKRKEKIQEIMKIRKFRKGLERLRADAKVEFVREQESYLQKELDDRSNMSFAGKLNQDG